MRPPEFWSGSYSASARLAIAALAPLGAAVDLAGRLRRRLASPYRAPVPVICVGNLTVGGAGKTPVALALAKRLKERNVHFLGHGYGAALADVTRVDPSKHDAGRVGDEALLLAALAPSWVARDRADAARAAVEAGAGLLIMDDGFQNPGLAKDLSLVVVDGGAGFGNGHVFPAGPLREDIRRGLARADALVLVGEDRTGALDHRPAGLALLCAEFEASAGTGDLNDRPVVAFAGIARPEKFFATVAKLGAHLVARHGFPDHHPYRASEIERLAGEAYEAGALLVTTEKDAVRLAPELKRLVTVIRIELRWREPEALDELLAPFLGQGSAP